MLRWILEKLVIVYQYTISPLFPPSCKYYPSCSAYALDSLRKHGAIKGVVMASWRLLRCNPWSLGGVDEVPDVWPPRHTTEDTEPPHADESSS